MSLRPEIPTRRCAPCDRDWPNMKIYNLCPRCQRCTYASTDFESPNRDEAAKDAERYQRIREFDKQADAEAQAAVDAWNAEMEALLEQTPTIPDPSPLNPQAVDFWDGMADGA